MTYVIYNISKIHNHNNFLYAFKVEISTKVIKLEKFVNYFIVGHTFLIFKPIP